MSDDLDRGRLRVRYRITGRIVLDTALHIGGRGAATVTDSPVIRDGTGRPFIPGSSLKGAFRAAVERLVPNIPGLRACGLSDASTGCLTVLAPTDERVGDYQEVSKSIGRRATDPVCRALERLRGAPLDDRGQVTEETILKLLERYLCDTCQAFGSPYLASAVFFQDARLSEVWRSLPEVPTQIRDGVGIDRDSERAREGVKFDFEVVPPGAEFDFRLVLENPGDRALGLVALGLQEFRHGMIPLGGIRSRGLGRCRLDGIEIARVDFGDEKAREGYLLHNRWESRPVETFISAHLGSLLGKEGD